MFWVKYEGLMRLPIKSWCNDIEDTALQQAVNLSMHPSVFHHIALMPDCLSDNTEILTSKGFKLIKELSFEDRIANYNPDTDKIYFKPSKNIIIRKLREGEKIFEFISTGLDKSIISTENHRMGYSANMGIMAKNIPKITSIRDYVWSGCGLECEIGVDISYELLCLIAWAVGDGSLKKSSISKSDSESTYILRFGLKKKRKINRILNLLDALKFKYNLRGLENGADIELNVDSSMKIVDFITYKKEYPKYFIEKLTRDQAMVLLEESIKVDGDWENYKKYGSIRYNSKREKDINFLSALISIHLGIANNNTRHAEDYKQVGMHYLSAISRNRLVESNSGLHKSHILKKEISYDGDVVCVTCDTGFFIARQNGLTFISGNCHFGYGVPIGCVMACMNAVIPSAVGVDISCGLRAVKTSLKVESLTHNKKPLKKILNIIRKLVPVGYAHHRQPQKNDLVLPGRFYTVTEREEGNLDYQLGTLGGGNHFIEIQAGDDGHIWFMIHCGSRNFGKKICEYYNREAKKLNKRWHSEVNDAWDLAFLPIGSYEAKAYIEEMKVAMAFAEENRKLISDRVKEAFLDTIDCDFYKDLDINHNYASVEHHFGRDVWVHRKGATSARKGQKGIIPGSMGTASYIVEGLGNPDSFHSCSHGAGRVMGRLEASRKLTEEECTESMKGIVFSGWGKNKKGNVDLGEAPQAYKDIKSVMKSQRDLVIPIVKLKPLGVVKDIEKGGKRR